VVLEVAKALNFLHARGVVHMDVKSNNVLLTSGGTAKLADVGLARLQTGTYLSDVPLIGTFAWVAPEVLMGGQGCTSAVDIFSLGVVMWEVITGERPQRGSLRAPRVPEECPQEVADLMMECLRLEPSQRPTASQVVQRLDSGQGQLEATSVVVPVRAPVGAMHMSEP
jgi:serine/threonine protein kinase